MAKCRASDELVVVGESSGGGPRGHIDLGEDVAQMPGNGLLAE
jgi:hypothetical protein